MGNYYNTFSNETSFYSEYTHTLSHTHAYIHIYLVTKRNAPDMLDAIGLLEGLGDGLNDIICKVIYYYSTIVHMTVQSQKRPTKKQKRPE